MKKLFLVIALLFFAGCFEDPEIIYTYTVDYEVYNYQGGAYTVEYLDETGQGYALDMSADFSYSFTVEGQPADFVLLVNNTSDTMLIMEVVFGGSEFLYPVYYEKTIEAGETGLVERFFNYE